MQEITVVLKEGYLFDFSWTSHTMAVTSQCSRTGPASATVLEDYTDQANWSSFPKALYNFSVNNGIVRLEIYFSLFKPDGTLFSSILIYQAKTHIITLSILQKTRFRVRDKSNLARTRI